MGTIKVFIQGVELWVTYRYGDIFEEPELIRIEAVGDIYELLSDSHVGQLTELVMEQFNDDNE